MKTTCVCVIHDPQAHDLKPRGILIQSGKNLHSHFPFLPHTQRPNLPGVG